MKIKIYIGIVTAFFLGSCNDLLENQIATNLTPDQIYVNYSRMREAAVGAYTQLTILSGFYQSGGSLRACMSDEAEETDYSSPFQKFNMGIWNQYSNPDDIYEKSYKAIRSCNLFLENSVNYEKILVTDTISSVGKETYKLQCQDIAYYRAEIRFLRAFYYFELIKRYGGVPLIKKSLSADEGRNIGRSSFDECVDFIVEQCDLSIKEMALDFDLMKQPENDGRATIGAAMALKSRALLYAASELHNPDNSREKWLKAAVAAKELLDLNLYGSSIKLQYELSPSYNDLFTGANPYTNNEVIFYIRHANSNLLESWSYPIGTPGGKSGVTPTQNLVDAYEKKSNWNQASPYENVDPRLGYTIATNNSTWNNRKLETYRGGKDGIDQRNASRTGYYLKKFLSPNLTLVGNTPGRSMKTWIFFRLGEVYLNYAEAMNTLYGPNGLGSADNSILRLSARSAINKIRRRGDVLMPNITESNQLKFTTILKRERQVELAFEEHRQWDVRRWNEAEVLGEPIRRATITKNGDQWTYDFTQVVENRTFDKKMYYYPIPQSEINKYPEVLKQNPLW